MPGIYSIPLAGLKEARYTHKFRLGDDFFRAFEGSEIQRGRFDVEVILHKRSSHLEVEIHAEGEAEVVCDRCLDAFFLPVTSLNTLLVRIGKEWEETDPDMVTLPVDESSIDLGQYFYEYIHLALPIKRIHPDDADGNSTCDPVMISKLNDHQAHAAEVADPRWEKLKKLTGNS